MGSCSICRANFWLVGSQLTIKSIPYLLFNSQFSILNSQLSIIFCDLCALVDRNLLVLFLYRKPHILGGWAQYG